MATLPLPAAGAESACTFNEVVAQYKDGLAAHGAKDLAAARGRWEPLAAMGFPPAQRRMGVFSRDGLAGLEIDVRKAGEWSLLAAREGDYDGQQAALEIKKKLGEGDFSPIFATVEGWRPQLPACLERGDGPAVAVDERSVRLGRALIRIERGAAVKDEYVGEVLDRAAQVVRMAKERSFVGRLLLPSVESYEILPSERYDRYVGWKAGEEGRILQMSVANLLDDSPAYAAHEVVLEARRELYRRLADSRLVDPHLWVHKGKKIYLSIYPDVDNKPFVTAVGVALDLIDRMPAGLRGPVEAIDQIRYNPQSKKMMRGGAPDATIAYYNHDLSVEGRRIVFVRRDMKWSSPADFFLTLVHEGTHVLQHATAERYERELPAKRAGLEALVKRGPAASAQASALQAEIAAMEEYAHLWFRRGPGEDPKKRLQRFECEATVREIEVASHFGLDPSVVERSAYLKVCDDAKAALATWKTQRYRQGLEQMKKQ